MELYYNVSGCENNKTLKPIMRREYVSYFSRTLGHEQGRALALSEGLASHQKLNVFSMYYVAKSISELQIQVATYVFELSAGNCHR
jgi:hypothetical protein